MQAVDEGGAEGGGEEGVFAVGLLAASPTRIAEDIDVGRPDGETEVDGVNVVAVGLVVLGAGLDGDDFPDFSNQRPVEGCCIANGLGEERGEAGAGDAVEAFVPPVVRRNTEAGNSRSGVDELSGFFVEGQAGDEIVDALLNRERGVEVR